MESAKSHINWDIKTAKHLLSRTKFGYNKTDLDHVLSFTLTDFIEKNLLTSTPLPPPPGEWVNDHPSEANGEHNVVFLKNLTHWYLSLLSHNSTFSLQERMVLFLHNHFTTEARKCWQIQWIYHQNKLFRKYALGNFKQLTKEVTVDGAMLHYLDGTSNTKKLVNENYSRELLELFTIGIGNYTQEDIKQGALALTGWYVYPYKLSVIFQSENHYKDKISYLGKSGKFNYQDLIEIIFEKPQTAKFICNKLCKEFICPQPDPGFVNRLADVFKENQYELIPALSYIFHSDYFYSSEVMATKIKNPLEFLLGTLQRMNIAETDFNYIRETSDRLGQELFNPPDVRGWPRQRKWLNSTTYSIRNDFTDAIINGVRSNGDPLPFETDILAFARSFTHAEDAEKFVEEVTDYLFQYPLSQDKKTYLLDILLDGLGPSYYNTYNEKAKEKLTKFFKTALKFPEYQLH